jgi:hypothetical protein
MSVALTLRLMSSGPGGLPTMQANVWTVLPRLFKSVQAFKSLLSQQQLRQSKREERLTPYYPPKDHHAEVGNSILSSTSTELLATDDDKSYSSFP